MTRLADAVAGKLAELEPSSAATFRTKRGIQGLARRP